MPTNTTTQKSCCTQRPTCETTCDRARGCPSSLCARMSLDACAARLDARCSFDNWMNETVYLRGSHRKQREQRAAEYRRRCVTPIDTAVSLARNTLLEKSQFRAQPIGREYNGGKNIRKSTEWMVVRPVLHHALRSPSGCLVYSFGVADNDTYVNFAAATGCSVYAFDPTVNHKRDMQHNVHFYPWGLRSSAENEAESSWSHRGYGGILPGAELLTLPQIIARLGHGSRKTIDAIKFDCEGCEFSTFRDLYCRGSSASSLPTISMIHTEFHFSVTLRMASLDDVQRIRFTGAYLRDNDYRVFQYRPHAGAPIDQVPGIHPDLATAGMTTGSCCYLYGFVQDSVLKAVT